MDDEPASFDLNASLKYYHEEPTSVPCLDAHQELLDAEESPESLSNAQINQILDPIIDSLAENPDAIARCSVLDSLQCLLKYFHTIPAPAAGKVLDIIVSGLSAETDIVNQDIESDEQDSIKEHRELLEIYGFLLQWVVAGLESRSSEKAGTSTSAAKGRKGKGKGKAGPAQSSDSTVQLKAALEVMCKALKLKLLRVFVTTSERDTFVSLFTRPVYLILENEQRVKNETIKMHVFKVLCIAVKHHGHAFGAQTSIVQNLTYFEHLSEPMAEFLQILSEQYDYPQLVDEILKELSNKEFNSNDSKGPKSVSGFIMSLSERAPRLVMKQMTLVIKLLENESYNLRNAVIEVSGNLIVELSKDDERSETNKAQMNAFFDLLEERFLDINPYCRSKAIQMYSTKLLDLDTKFPKRRQKAADLACRSLEDKSSHVRRYAIKLLTKLIATHPFSALHGGTLKRSEWAHRLEVLDAELNALIAPVEEMAGNRTLGNETVDPELLDDATDDENEENGDQRETEARPDKPPAQSEQDNTETITRLQLTRRYYVEALRFIDTIHSASEVVMQLLSAKNKSEIIEAMDFFKSLDVHKVETAKTGIRRMLRLIWTKGNSDEGKGVQAHLIETYKDLFFDAPDTFSENECANYIARNMISLTFDTTAAELTSLEQLLSKMMKENHISDLVVQKLWQIYGVQKREISKSQRRGAIIVLGMLALAEPEIVIKELETILRVGLGPLGRSDLGLAKYTCLALRHISPVGRKAKDAPSSMGKLSNDHAILVRLASLAELASDSKDWFGVAEQVIGAIYSLAKCPDVLCTEIIRRKTKTVFENKLPTPSPTDPAEDQVMQEAGLEESDASPEVPQDASFFPLSQLLFVVGHVAIKQIVHLEILELEFKRRKTEQEKAKEATTPKKKGDNDEQDELDLIGGTTEDDFTEGIARVREQELLYGENSLLSNFGPLVTEICTYSGNYPDRNLQAQATLCMAKLMCVSSEYCEENLPLLITIMERSTDPITRSNAVIALGDMAVCFNHLIDENTDFLYRRLNDNEASVKRTCLMTLTFLILAGQVKVKGQLGEMAKCLEDSDKRIADLSRMFFTELATKDNAVYNHFVDMFSLLSAERDLKEDAMKRIVKFLASFIEKDKHAKQLSEKLAARLPRCETERQWNDVAYALSLLPHKNEDIQKAVIAGFRVVQASA
ncbi:condensin complex component cnd1 [Trichophaea hybrida]|nr:condensin complex component cnd1 [Trichophaea hybrida]